MTSGKCHKCDTLCKNVVHETSCITTPSKYWYCSQHCRPSRLSHLCVGCQRVIDRVNYNSNGEPNFARNRKDTDILCLECCWTEVLENGQKQLLHYGHFVCSGNVFEQDMKERVDRAGYKRVRDVGYNSDIDGVDKATVVAFLAYTWNGHKIVLSLFTKPKVFYRQARQAALCTLWVLRKRISKDLARLIAQYVYKTRTDQVWLDAGKKRKEVQK